MPDRLAAQLRHLPAAGGPLEPHRTGTPAGRLYPTTRDELVECAALLRGVQQGRLDAIVVPRRPLDILAQQMVAESAAEPWPEGELLGLARRAAPFRDLSAEDFEDITDLLAEGIRTGRGRRAYYLHRDRVNGTVKGRRGARLAALTSGGAIPELGDFRVVAEPNEVQIGTVHEEWAVESRPGDVFLLGTHSWRIRRVEPAPSGWSTRTARRLRCRTGKGRHPGAPGSSPRRSRRCGRPSRTGSPRRPGHGSSKSAGSAGPRPTPSSATCGPGWPRSGRCRP